MHHHTSSKPRPSSLLAMMLVAAMTVGGHAIAGLNQFQLVATSPTTIFPGEAVSFDLILNYGTDVIRNVSYPGEAEPGPVFAGDQRWYHGGGIYESIFYNYGLARITSDAGHTLQSYIGGLSTWSISLAFSDPGNYTVLADGSYVTTDSTHYWDSYSTRGCFFFICGGWEHHNPSYSYNQNYSLSFPAQTLTVQVVPEPQPWASLIFALALIALRMHRELTHSSNTRRKS